MGGIVIVAVLLIVLGWFFWPSKAPARPHQDNPELDVAERDVQEAPDEETVRDWGPGTGQKPLP
jgi:hypothetical protein